jgi:hypothetical protein
VRCAYLSATIFIGASGATNLTYGWQKGSDLASSCVWAAVAGAVAIVFALSWPALIRSVDARRYSAALIALAAMLLSGAYCVTAALGSAAGGRANAAATETATTDARAKAQAAYDVAKAELESLTAAKPGAELQSLIETTKAELAKLPAGRSVAEVEALDRRYPGRDCGAENGTGRWICQRPDPYAAELARARQRERLAAKLALLVVDAGKADDRLAAQRTAARTALERAAAELGRIQPARVANSDAKALTRYLGALGVEVSPDQLNDLLILLAVVMVEFGGGLSLAIGMALSGAPAPEHAERPEQARDATVNAQSAAIETLPAPVISSSVQVRSAPAPAVQAADILALVAAAGGALRTTTRRLGAQIGRPAASVHGELRRLAGVGLITLNTDSRGTLITAAPAGRPN